MIDSDAPSIETIRAKQKGRRNSALAIIGGALGTSLTVIVHLVQMQQADAEKRELAGRAAVATVDAESIERKLDHMAGEVALTRQDIANIRERLARVETTLEERGKKR